MLGCGIGLSLFPIGISLAGGGSWSDGPFLFADSYTSALLNHTSMLRWGPVSGRLYVVSSQNYLSVFDVSPVTGKLMLLGQLTLAPQFATLSDIIFSDDETKAIVCSESRKSLCTLSISDPANMTLTAELLDTTLFNGATRMERRGNVIGVGMLSRRSMVFVDCADFNNLLPFAEFRPDATVLSGLREFIWPFAAEAYYSCETVGTTVRSIGSIDPTPILSAVPKGPWVTATSYLVNDAVQDAANHLFYICLSNHTSGTLATDIAAGKWQILTPTERWHVVGGTLAGDAPPIDHRVRTAKGWTSGLDLGGTDDFLYGSIGTGTGTLDDGATAHRGALLIAQRDGTIRGYINPVSLSNTDPACFFGARHNVRIDNGGKKYVVMVSEFPSNMVLFDVTDPDAPFIVKITQGPSAYHTLNGAMHVEKLATANPNVWFLPVACFSEDGTFVQGVTVMKLDFSRLS